MGLFDRLAAALLPKAKQDPDPEVHRLREERMHRHCVSYVIDPRADRQLADHLFQTGRTAEAFDDVKSELIDADTLAKRLFPQCTPRERRGVVAMQRMDLFRQLSRFSAAWPGRAAAYGGIAHGWWIVGLAIQGDRGPEIKLANTSEKWSEAVNGNATLLAVALHHRRIRSETEVEALSLALWTAAGQAPHERIAA